MSVGDLQRRSIGRAFLRWNICLSALLNLVLITIPYDDVMSYIVQFDIDFFA